MGKHAKIPAPSTATAPNSSPNAAPAAKRSTSPGGKRAKRPANGARRAPANEPTTDIEVLRKRSVAHCDRLLGAVEAALLAGDGNATLVRETAAIARAITMLAAEDRAREKMLLTFARGLQPSVVITYLRGLTDDEYERLLGEVDRLRTVGIGTGESALAANGVPRPRSGLA